LARKLSVSSSDNQERYIYNHAEAPKTTFVLEDVDGSRNLFNIDRPTSGKIKDCN